MKSIILRSRKHTSIKLRWSLWVSREASPHPEVSDPMWKPSFLNFHFHKQCLSSSCYLKVAHSEVLPYWPQPRLALTKGWEGRALTLHQIPSLPVECSHDRQHRITLRSLSEQASITGSVFLKQKANEAPRPKDFTVINKASQVWRKTFQTSDIWWSNLEGNLEGNYSFFT